MLRVRIEKKSEGNNGCRAVAWSKKREEELREQGCREVA